jgi:Flp pilus assembly protein TadD
LLAVKFSPKDARASYFAAMAYEELGKTKEAKSYYKKAAKLNSKDVLAPAALKRMEMGMSLEEAVANGIRIK